MFPQKDDQMILHPTPREGYYVVELNRSVWVVPNHYINLTPIGTGAYGTVWWVDKFAMGIFNFQLFLVPRNAHDPALELPSKSSTVRFNQ